MYIYCIHKHDHMMVKVMYTLLSLVDAYMSDINTFVRDLYNLVLTEGYISLFLKYDEI